MSSPIKRHFFVCSNTRPPMAKPSCGQKNANNIFMKMMEEVEKRGLFGNVAVTPAGCLGPCFDGPVMVVYPEAVWYANITEEDVAEIAEKHMANGEVVERLQYTWPNAM